MRELMLIVHFLGLAMGLGTSFGFMFLGIAASKMEKDDAQKFTLNTFVISTMGHIGLTLLIISGLYLITPYWGALSNQPYLIAKLILVLILIVVISILSIAAGKAKKGDLAGQAKKIQALGKVSLLVSIAIVVLAVLNFK